MNEMEKAVATAKTQIQTIEQEAHGLAIEDDADVVIASHSLQQIAGHRKELETQRQFFVGPLNEQVKRINDMWKSITAPLERADAEIRGKMIDYRKRQAEAAAAEKRRLDAEAAKAQQRENKRAAKAHVQPVQVVAPVPVVAPPPTTVGAVTARKVWKWRLVDRTKLPEKYLVVDGEALGRDVRGGAREIPGVEIYEEETLAVRA